MSVISDLILWRWFLEFFLFSFLSSTCQQIDIDCSSVIYTHMCTHTFSPETRSFASSASRTLQRRRQIFAQLKSGQYGDYSKPSHPLGGSDSVHRVSAASSVEDLTEEVEVKELTNGDDFQKELASMEEDALFSQEL